mgnify:CR=1 FL=1
MASLAASPASGAGVFGVVAGASGLKATLSSRFSSGVNSAMNTRKTWAPVLSLSKTPFQG